MSFLTVFGSSGGSRKIRNSISCLLVPSRSLLTRYASVFEIPWNHSFIFSEKDDGFEKKDDHPIILFVYACLFYYVFF